VEITRFLTSKAVGYGHTLGVLGTAEYGSDGGSASTVAVLHEFTANTVNSWQFVLDALGRFYEQAMTQSDLELPAAMAVPRPSLWQLASGDALPAVKQLLGANLEWAALLGKRTGELHRALAGDGADAAFASEPFSQLYQRSLYQSWRRLTLRSLAQLRRRQIELSDEAREIARAVLEHEKPILEAFRAIVGKKLLASRIRCHGNFCLEHVLYAGKDFLIVDFEGDTSRPLSARRLKRSPLEDVAGMVHSFQSAASHALRHWPHAKAIPEARGDALADFWYLWTSSAFLRAYAASVADTNLLPRELEQLEMLLHIHLLERALRELEFELTDDGQWIVLPLRRIMQLVCA
jgi:maltose alpha-D-glucosyltransferase/alpha-amylase